MDFIKKLLLSSGFNTILVIVDWLTKQAIFTPAHDTITSTDLTRLFIFHVFSKHGVPSHITSDRGLEFVSNFFCSLDTALNMWLHFTSELSRLSMVDSILFSCILFYCSFSFFFYFSIFRMAWVRVDQSRCHISHNLMA